MDPIMAKAWAALQAVIFSREVGFFDIMLEGDAMQRVNVISTPLAT
jgi:hypothetical protein